MRTRVVLVVALALALATTGCLKLAAATVPDKLLEGRGGNGWSKNQTASQKEPTSRDLGFLKTQTLAYDDRTSDEGYPGSLTVTTIRSLLRPSEERLRDTVEARIKEDAAAKGIRITGSPDTGERPLANGATSFWFAHDGTVDRSGFFSQSATVKVFGEVFQCEEERTVVVTVGLAQTSDVRSIGGVPLPSEPDDATWREIVADPRGRIEGIRGSNGLAYHVAC